MKVYRISPTYYDREMTNTVIVVAENKEQALSITKKGNPFDEKVPFEVKDKIIWWKYEDQQYPLVIDEIDLNVAQVLVAEWIE